ncbi:hypothetical protein DESUT3_17130 [Desulfuromonas versatilis]|uniref:Uncharacterized protein n=1 Tax=Desulfuromonas versatilis TaxID=2802975 RepID=A0ABN6DYR8_9BACT|nr:hypothetical protein DESUT3_17130 [Desulfuromonas versatilis]
MVELLVVMAIMAMIGMITYPFFTNYQFQAIKELNKSDLDDRGNRVLNFIAEEIRETGFGVGALPKFADDSQISIGGTTFAASIVATDGGASGEDSLSILKARSFFQRLSVSVSAGVGDTTISLSRALTAGEIDPTASALSGVVFENHKSMYRVTAILTGPSRITLAQPLAEPVSAGTEVLGVRAVSFSLGGGNLTYNNFIDPAETLLSGVDGLQFSYLDVGGGAESNTPGASEDVRGIRTSVLARAPRTDKGFNNTDPYDNIANRDDYGPFNDGFRREEFSRLVEVKNNAY